MIADLVGALLGVLVGGGGDGRRKLRRQHEAFAAGEPVTFPVHLVGDLPYCRPAGGFLTVSRQALVASPTREAGLAPRQLPAERLELVRIRPRRRGDPWTQHHWHVAECRDGGADVLIACDPGCLELVTPLLGRPPVAP